MGRIKSVVTVYEDHTDVVFESPAVELKKDLNRLFLFDRIRKAEHPYPLDRTDQDILTMLGLIKTLSNGAVIRAPIFKKNSLIRSLETVLEICKGDHYNIPISRIKK